MTKSGEPTSGAGGANDADWIDQILDRATKQSEMTGKRQPPPSSTPIEPAPVASTPTRTPTSAATRTPTRAPSSTPTPVDSLTEISWVDAPRPTPSSAPLAGAAQPAQPSTTDTSTLVPSDVGRSAWDQQLAVADGSDPEGWDKLSWQDLDERDDGDHSPVSEDTSFGRMVREWGPVLFAAFAIAVFTRLVLVQAYHIPSESMVPTLEDGDRVVVNRLSYQFGEVQRGQVVVFAKPLGTSGENDLIKRVIGLPGETIRFVDNQVYIDGFRLEEPYLLQQDSTRPRFVIPGCDQIETASDLCVIPDGHVFVMGDNRLGSSDGRVFGPISIDSIVGRAFTRVWPLNNVGQL